MKKIMFNIKNLWALFLLLIFTSPMAIAAPATPVQSHQAKPVKELPLTKASPLGVVTSPSQYLGKRVIMDAKFDKFSTLGLDYKKAFRDSTEYIGFLIQRDDVRDHNIPLSELKLFIKRDYAEKFIDLNTGDKISLTGVVFSTALGDAWIDVDTIQVLEKAPSDRQGK